LSGLARNAPPITWTTLKMPPAFVPNLVATLPGLAAFTVTSPAFSPAASAYV
jgi:hypothetical protein